MARLIGSSESNNLDTDFAQLFVGQEGFVDDANTMTFAASAPGLLAMMCGTKYARLSVRLERWDGRPGSPDDDWEDCDELPGAFLPDAGPVTIRVFDPPDTGSLAVEDVDRARVQVLATGRHRYRYSSEHVDELAPERWLIRIWPDPQARDAMAGPPRRIAGALPFSANRSGWRAAFHAWAQTGWHQRFEGIEGFREIGRSMVGIGRPFSQEELPPRWGPWGKKRDQGGGYTWQSPVLGRGWNGRLEELFPEELRILRLLADAAGLRSIDTFQDAFHCLRQLGLVARCDHVQTETWVPNPAPRPVWEVLDLSSQEAFMARLGPLHTDYMHLQADLEHLLRWAPEATLVTTPRQIAVRLSLTSDDVIGTLRLLDHLGQVTLQPQVSNITADTTIHMTVSCQEEMPNPLSE